MRHGQMVEEQGEEEKENRVKKKREGEEEQEENHLIEATKINFQKFKLSQLSKFPTYSARLLALLAWMMKSSSRMLSGSS